VSRRGRLIVLEGGEGAGKSTHARFIHDWLVRRGRQVVLTREPGGSPLAEAIRELVLRPWDETMDATTELLLMFAARAAHLHATIHPALEAGQDVVCDRFLDATYAYQGAGRRVPDRTISDLAKIVLKTLRPQLVILLDVDPRVGIARARSRGIANRFDNEELDFQNRVRAAYLRRAHRSPSRYAIVDADRPLAPIRRNLERVLKERL
jgi:dTMP kinase